MDKVKNFISMHIPTRRRLIQVYAALLYNAHIKGFIKGDIYTGPLKNFCVPGFNCYSCPGAVGACPLGALQNALASSDKRAPYFVFGILMLLGLTFGRTICGFLCPLGLVQELLDKINVPKLKKSRITHVLSYLKYVILLIFVILIPLRYSVQSYPVPGFCKYICPAGTLEGAVGLLSNPANEAKLSMLNILFTRKFIIAVLIVLSCVFIYRAFCRFLCPLGAIYGLFSKVSLLGVRVDTDKCIDCGKCLGHCKMDICHVGDHECIQCGDCIKQCPTGAISYKFGGIKLGSNIDEENNDGSDSSSKKKMSVRRKMGIAWIVAILFLAFVIWFVNRPDNNESAASDSVVTDSSEETVGYEVGDLCPDFTAPVYGSDTPFTLSEHLGKVVVVNFWATYCTPCCAELPNFDRLYTTYRDDVDVIALHAKDDYDGAEDYLAGFDYKMPFGHDETGEIIKAMGGSTLLPQTVIVDRTGHIVYNDTTSMSYEKLEGIVKPLLNGDSGNAGISIVSDDGDNNATADETSDSIELGDKFPDFTVELAGGGEFSLSEELKDHKAVLINIWATWCNPCKIELPYMDEAYEKYSDDVAVVCLSKEPSDSPDIISDFEKSINVSLPMGQDTPGISDIVGGRYIPKIIVVDRYGNYVFFEEGAFSSESQFERLFDYFIGDDYTESKVLDAVPLEKPCEALPDDELTEAVCPDGSLLFTTPTDDEYCWPFVKAENGVVNSNAAKDPVVKGGECTAEMDTSFEAGPGDVFAFDYSIDSDNYYYGLSVEINGTETRFICGSEKGTYLYEIPQKGNYDIKLIYKTSGYVRYTSDTITISNAGLFSGKEASRLISEQKTFPKTLEGNDISMEIAGAKEIVFDDESGTADSIFGENTRYYVADGKDKVNAHVCIGSDVDPYYAIVYDSVDNRGTILPQTDPDRTGFNYEQILSKVENGGRCYTMITAFSDRNDEDSDSNPVCVIFANEENANYFAANEVTDDNYDPIEGITWKYADNTAPSTDKIAEEEDNAGDGTATYTINVVDEDGNPVDGCIVNICTDTMCSPSEATDGQLIFTKDAYPYSIHVIKYPDGYTFDKSQEFTMPSEGGTLTITLQHSK